ncbi:MAG: hypothetical protein F6K24_02620 [Okeania sp. SIO2D1]|nr:hypothetical protein [Okeania sp. SIO2D1]
MLLFFSPVFNLLSKSEKQAKLVYLGVELIPANDTNKSLQVSGDFHHKLLSYIKQHIDAAIAEMENKEAIAVKTQEPTITTSQIDYTPEELDAYDSVFGEQPPTPAPSQDEKIVTDSDENLEITPDPAPTSEANEVPASEKVDSFQKPESDSTEQIFDELKSESLKERMLSCKNRSELEKFKVEIGSDKADKVWDSCSIIERNLIKCANAAMDKKAATPFDLIQWRDVLGKLQNARYVGFYLHGLQIKNEDDRVIYLTNQDIFKVVDKRSLKAVAAKSQKPCPPELVVKLEKALSEPEDTAPTADEIANNTFSGLVPVKKQQTGLQTGNKPELPPSEPSVVQTALDLKTPPPEQKKSKVTATPLLELVASEIKKVNPELTFDYDSNGKSTFLDIYHGSSSIGTFEDDGEDLWSFNTAKMLHHGFTKEMIDALGEIELSPKA